MQDEATTVDNQQTADQQSIDIKSLLEVANSSKFDETETLKYTEVSYATILRATLGLPLSSLPW